MSQRTFQFDLPPEADSEAWFVKVQALAREKGIEISGRPESATFDGLARGTLRLEGPTLHVCVVEKPPLVPWAVVQEGLSRLLRTL